MQLILNISAILIQMVFPCVCNIWVFAKADKKRKCRSIQIYTNCVAPLKLTRQSEPQHETHRDRGWAEWNIFHCSQLICLHRWDYANWLHGIDICRVMHGFPIGKYVQYFPINNVIIPLDTANRARRL